jgi:type IV pilus assembly protein PilF
MRLSEVGRSGLLRGLYGVLLAGSLVLGLSACAGGPAVPAGDAPGDLVTESDEPESRKRARIRLELAIGYFEQGQTTVALDELKQSLAADPNFAPAYNLRGLIYMRLNDLRLAEDSFRRALALAPRDGNVLHNYGWLLCQQARYGESLQAFSQALANPTYGARAKTWMTQGLCELRAGQKAEAEHSLSRSFELEPGNPVTSYNLAWLLFQRGDLARAQFFVRRINNSELANAESLWLGIRTEQKLGNQVAVEQLAAQLRKRYPQSRELEAYERGAFHE